jgi:hypothetical protein
MIRCDPIFTAPTARSYKATRTPPIITLKFQHSAHELMPPCSAATRDTDSLHTYRNFNLLLRKPAMRRLLECIDCTDSDASTAALYTNNHSYRVHKTFYTHVTEYLLLVSHTNNT